MWELCMSLSNAFSVNALIPCAWRISISKCIALTFRLKNLTICPQGYLFWLHQINKPVLGNHISELSQSHVLENMKALCRRTQIVMILHCIQEITASVSNNLHTLWHCQHCKGYGMTTPWAHTLEKSDFIFPHGLLIRCLNTLSHMITISWSCRCFGIVRCRAISYAFLYRYCILIDVAEIKAIVKRPWREIANHNHTVIDTIILFALMPYPFVRRTKRIPDSSLLCWLCTAFEGAWHFYHYVSPFSFPVSWWNCGWYGNMWNSTETNVSWCECQLQVKRIFLSHLLPD